MRKEVGHAKTDKQHSINARHQTHQAAVTSSTKSQSHARQQSIKSKKRLTRHQLTGVRLPKTNHILI
ncbi:hypothetical protein LCW_01665 [Latilactobacillus curvatus]|nr:hypothetical protein LCW_01665 [Latilactobacillus curvatus]